MNKNVVIGILIGVVIGLGALLFGFYTFTSQVTDAVLNGVLGQ